MATTITVKGTEIRILRQEQEDFISLTDMLKAKDGDFFISDWLRNRNTVEFLGIWETVHNPNFNYGEFAIIRSQAGLNNYKISVKEGVKKNSAIGIKATAGRYGGTYAHKDIAFEFGMWISAEFKIYQEKMGSMLFSVGRTNTPKAFNNKAEGRAQRTLGKQPCPREL